MARPVIALLTDFGQSDHYVAAMKGVILSICPDATLLDITHDIPPQDIVSGALELAAVAPYLPEGTIVVGVIDPGVGSTRRGIALETRSGLRCVGPDNGLFALVTGPDGPLSVVSIENPAYMRGSVSRTFEGRDRFAPAAAWLATGVALPALGPAVAEIVRLDLPEPTETPDGIEGHVVRVDRFGNLITNIREASLQPMSDAAVYMGDVRIGRVTETYAESASGSLCALVGSSGRLEVAVNGGHAASLLRASRGARVLVRRLGRA